MFSLFGSKNKETILALKNRIFELETEAKANNDKSQKDEEFIRTMKYRVFELETEVKAYENNIKALEKSHEIAQKENERLFGLYEKALDKKSISLSQNVSIMWTNCTINSSSIESGISNTTFSFSEGMKIGSSLSKFFDQFIQAANGRVIEDENLSKIFKPAASPKRPIFDFNQPILAGAASRGLNTGRPRGMQIGSGLSKFFNL